MLPSVATPALRRITPWLILATMTACDNVRWGGAEVHLLPPPARDTVPSDTLASATDSARLATADLPRDPVLFIGRYRDGSASLVPLGEWTSLGLQALPAYAEAPDFDRRWAERQLLVGTELVLIAGGARVGTMQIDEVAPATDWCEPRLQVTGAAVVESGAAQDGRVLGFLFPEGDDGRLSGEAYRSPAHTYPQRVAGIDLAIEAVAQLRADWPESMVNSRKDMQSVPLASGGESAIAATFVFRDSLAAVPPRAPGSYGLMIVGEADNGDWRTTYTWYRVARSGGKAIAQLFGHGDLDVDGRSELVLEVFTDSTRGAVLLERDAEGWNEAFISACPVLDPTLER